MSTQLVSPAKINITLKVIGFDKNLSKHKLSSKIVLLKLSDTIKISSSNRLSVRYSNNKKKINIQNDIIKKTIIYFDKKYGTNSKFNILIKKDIPIGYGLGGGSSNAATILKFLYNHHNINFINFDVDAPRIGSDVLLFKDTYPKIIDGLDKYKKIYIKKPRWKKIFLIFPQKKNITKKIFNIYKKNKKDQNTQSFFKNDLVISSMIFNKEFKNLYYFLLTKKNKFELKGMSGSGSSIFISFKSNNAEKTILNDIRSKYPLVRIEKSYYFS